jgi:hypothetical protein
MNKYLKFVLPICIGNLGFNTKINTNIIGIKNISKKNLKKKIFHSTIINNNKYPNSTYGFRIKGGNGDKIKILFQDNSSIIYLNDLNGPNKSITVENIPLQEEVIGTILEDNNSLKIISTLNEAVGHPWSFNKNHSSFKSIIKVDKKSIHRIIFNDFYPIFYQLLDNFENVIKGIHILANENKKEKNNSTNNNFIENILEKIQLFARRKNPLIKKNNNNNDGNNSGDGDPNNPTDKVSGKNEEKEEDKDEDKTLLKKILKKQNNNEENENTFEEIKDNKIMKNKINPSSKDYGDDNYYANYNSNTFESPSLNMGEDHKDEKDEKDDKEMKEKIKKFIQRKNFIAIKQDDISFDIGYSQKKNITCNTGFSGTINNQSDNLRFNYSIDVENNKIDFPQANLSFIDKVGDGNLHFYVHVPIRGDVGPNQWYLDGWGDEKLNHKLINSKAQYTIGITDKKNWSADIFMTHTPNELKFSKDLLLYDSKIEEINNKKNIKLTEASADAPIQIQDKREFIENYTKPQDKEEKLFGIKLKYHNEEYGFNGVLVGGLKNYEDMLSHVTGGLFVSWFPLDNDSIKGGLKYKILRSNNLKSKLESTMTISSDKYLSTEVKNQFEMEFVFNIEIKKISTKDYKLTIEIAWSGKNEKFSKILNNKLDKSISVSLTITIKFIKIKIELKDEDSSVNVKLVDVIKFEGISLDPWNVKLIRDETIKQKIQKELY